MKQFCNNGHNLLLVGKTNAGACKTCRQEAHLRWRKRNPEKMREVTRRSDLKMSYGLTPEKWQYMFDQQKGCCAICGKHQSQIKAKLCVDHDHRTGKVRELLCVGCNVAVGHYENHKNKIEKYLGAHSSDSSII